MTFIRPVADYAVPAYQSMLTVEQKTKLERQQANALKIIYGFQHSYKELLEMSGLGTLERRRHELTDKFATKMKNNSKFSYLFPERTSEQRRARNGKRFVEFEARTSRLFNSPLYHMRRRLNEMEKEGRDGRKEDVREAPAGTAQGRARCDFLFDEWR